MRGKTIIISISVLSVLLLASLTFVLYIVFGFTPKELGPALITFWFIGILIGLTSLITLIDYLWKLRSEEKRNEPRKILLGSVRTGFLLGFTATLLIALSTLKSLSFRDIILFALTVLLIELYFRTRKTN